MEATSDRVSMIVQITDRIARIAQTADHGTIEDYLRQFTPDAVWQMPAGPTGLIPGQSRRGHAEIAEGVLARRQDGVQGPGSGTRHVVGTSVVEAGSDPDSATAVSYFRFYTGTDRTPTLAGIGVYHDEFRRVGERWLLSARRIAFDHTLSR